MKKKLIVLLMIFGFTITIGCSPKYQSVENPDVVISKQLGYVYQVGIWARVSYDILKSTKKNFCKVQLLDDYECGMGDLILKRFNGLLTVYSKVATEWYKLEIKPENSGRVQLTTENAKEIIKAMFKNRQALIKEFQKIAGDKLKLPELPVLTGEVLAFAEIPEKEVNDGN